ncbi:MAG: CDGSH iron-sulfur domain-containing protein [Solirubrobacteraceae bacterium]
MAGVQVMAGEDGPYKVTGEIELVDHNRNIVDTGGKTTVFLCRCAGSTNKPFCDGTHSKIGFQGAMAAVEKGG